MRRWLRRIRGAIGMGLTWAAAWFGVGMLVVAGVLLTTGTRPEVPVPVVFAVFGLFGGITFSATLSVFAARHRFAELSLPRFAAWGAGAGFVLSAAFVATMAVAGNAGFLWNLVGLGPFFAAAGAGSAAGSLALARKAGDPELPAGEAAKSA